MILFITRKYPPSVGGMQKLSYYLTTTVAHHVPVHIIKWGRSQGWLPFFALSALVRALLVLGTRPVNLIHISDAALTPLGLLLRAVGRRPVVVNVHGRDVTYPNRLYQGMLCRWLKRLDCVVCNSEHTRKECLARGVDPGRAGVIPVGVDAERFSPCLEDGEETFWMRKWGLESGPKHILLTVGRLVPRKGVSFFVSEVLPKLANRRNDWIYLIAGDGPERQRIEAAVAQSELEKVVRVLGQVSDDELRAAYALADLFVMPNIRVEGDCEGFGLVTLEARAAGLPVVASSLEGISDSFLSADDSILVPPGDAEAFAEAIDCLLQPDLLTLDARSGRRARVKSRYDWTHVVERYLAVFRDVQAHYDSIKVSHNP